MFRQHDEAPEEVVSPLYRQLTQEWATLHALTSTGATVRRWGRLEPALTGFTRPGDIVDAIDAAAPERKDELLLALVRLFQRGQQLAGRTVLQAMLPKLVRISLHVSACLTDASDRDGLWEEKRHIAVAEFWDIMADYPAERRPTSLSGNLALDTLQRVQQRRRPVEDVPVDPHEMSHEGQLPYIRVGWRGKVRHIVEHSGTRADTDLCDPFTADSDLVEVLAWATRTQVITGSEAQLLALSYMSDESTACGFARAAAHFGVTETAARQRCSRASRRLRDAVQKEMQPPLMSLSA